MLVLPTLFSFLLGVFFSALSPGVFAATTGHLAPRDDNLPARVPYVFPPPGTDPIADALRARRTNGTLLDLDGVLLDAPILASGWNTFFGVVRDNSTLPGAMRELFILRVAVLTSSSYVWLQHESVGRSEGLTTSQLEAIRFTQAVHGGNGVPKKAAKTLGPSLSAALAFADASTNSVFVPDETFKNLQQFLNVQQLVEAAATVGAYNLVSRFVVALNVDAKMAVPVSVPK